jgi:hypothetical protein
MKGGQDEKSDNCGGSSSGGSSLGAWRAPMAEALNKPKYHVKEGKK